MGEGSVEPVAAGLAVGAALVVLLASIFNTIDHDFADNRNHINIAIQGLKDEYASGERMAFGVHISGYLTECDSWPRIKIVNSDSGETMYDYNVMIVSLCREHMHYIDRSLTTDGPDNQLGDVIINKNGNYKLIVEQNGKTAEKEFSVTYITQDAQNFAVKITRNLDEAKEFFSVYPDANTTVYFITTCADEFCSTLRRIPSVVEYWYKAEDQEYAELRVTIDYDEGKATFSQVNCNIYGIEDSGIGMYGAVSLEGVAELLKDSHCPNS